MSIYINEVPKNVSYDVGDKTITFMAGEDHFIIEIENGNQLVFFNVKDIERIRDILSDILRFWEEVNKPENNGK